MKGRKTESDSDGAVGMEMGKWLLDVAKYVLTAILLTALFDGTISSWEWYMYIIYVVVLFGAISAGLVMIRRNGGKQL